MDEMPGGGGTRSQRAMLRAILQTDLPSFVRKAFETVSPGDRYVESRHIEAICHRLLLLLGGAGVGRRRLVVNLPPRSLKSTIVSVAFPAWVLGHDPSARIIVASYSDDLARRLARDFRRVVEAPWYRELFPAMRIDARKNTEAEVATTAGGFRYATSVGGTLTGRGGDLVVIDDPIKPMDAASDAERRRVNEWFDSTVMSRLDDPATAAVVLVMQRVHEDDLAGHLLEKGGWSLLRLPAIATEAEAVALGQGRVHRRAPGELLEPGRLAMAELEEARRHLGAQLFEAQYQQDPVPAGRYADQGGVARHLCRAAARAGRLLRRWCRAGTWRARRAGATTGRSAPAGACATGATGCSTCGGSGSSSRTCCAWRPGWPRSTPPPACWWRTRARAPRWRRRCPRRHGRPWCRSGPGWTSRRGCNGRRRCSRPAGCCCRRGRRGRPSTGASCWASRAGATTTRWTAPPSS